MQLKAIVSPSSMRNTSTVLLAIKGPDTKI